MSWQRPIPLVGDTTSAQARGQAPQAWAFEAAARDAFYAAVGARRDIRRFRPDEVPPAVLQRILGAAHAAPSVGHSQPWRFVVVRRRETRDRAALLADREWHRQAARFDDRSSRHMLDLQLHGIRDAPLGVVVCCDRRTAAEAVIGRATFVDADLWSCAAAIENLWLAARVEGVGVGWVTLFRPEELAELVGLPDGVETLGWLCLGWPDERPPEPGLQRAGWSTRQPLSDVVRYERWDGEDDHEPVAPISHLRAPLPSDVVGARDESDVLLTPPGSLGVLDRAVDRLVAVGLGPGSPVTAVIVAASHPVTRHGVSTYADDVTHEVLAATTAGESLGAVAARLVGATLDVVDAGVDGVPVPGAAVCRPADPRGDLVERDALSSSDVRRLLLAGRKHGNRLSGHIVVLGEVGIGNTTVAAALVAARLELQAEDAVGLGAGGDAGTLARKRALVDAALARATTAHEDLDEPMVALAALGGPEIAYLSGVTLGAAEAGALVVLDGLVTSSAALVAVGLEPGAAPYLVAGQESREQVHGVLNRYLGLEPLLSLRLRSGEGVGGLLAAQLLRSAAGLRAETGRVAERS
jgi:nicotinate-nucleotide--dimethylbenzimidazole phosphoribosyltransferase